MNKRLPFTIQGAGHAVPNRVMTNADFEKFLAARGNDVRWLEL